MNPCDDKWTTHRGATPFDTGGLWHGFIVTQPALNEDEKRLFVSSHECLLCEWREKFISYVQSQYGSMSSYILGVPPHSSTGCILNSLEMNASRAWTWEARVERTDVADTVLLSAFYCDKDTHDRIRDHILDTGRLNRAEKRACVTVLRRLAVIIPLGTRPASFLRQELINAIR